MAFFPDLDTSTILVALLGFLLVFFTFKRPANIPPGPCGFPVIGCLPNLVVTVYRTGFTEPYKLLDYLAKQFGSVYSMYITTQLVVVLNNYDSVREAFRNPKLNDRPKISLVSEAETGVLMSSGDIWTRQRRLTLNTFRDFGIGKSRFQDQISTEADRLKQALAKYHSKPFDPRKFLSTAVSNVICSVVFGKRFEYTDAEFLELLHNLDAQIAAASSGGLILFLPFAVNLFPKTKESTIKTTNLMTQFVSGIVNDHKSNFDCQDLKDYIDVYLNELRMQAGMAEEKQLQNVHDLSEESLIHSVIQLFVAGSETTVTTLRWCFIYMMAYPEIQTRVQEEIDSVVGRNRLPRISDKLPYTEATIMEVQRIASIVPFGVPHVAAEDTTLLGFLIPKGTILVPNLWAIHHDPEIWSEPDTFKPERFLNENGSVRHRPEYVPFSIGRRNCLGENLAKMELFVFFTHTSLTPVLLQEARWFPSDFHEKHCGFN